MRNSPQLRVVHLGTFSTDRKAVFYLYWKLITTTQQMGSIKIAQQILNSSEFKDIFGKTPILKRVCLY